MFVGLCPYIEKSVKNFLVVCTSKGGIEHKANGAVPEELERKPDGLLESLDGLWSVGKDVVILWNTLDSLFCRLSTFLGGALRLGFSRSRLNIRCRPHRAQVFQASLCDLKVYSTALLLDQVLLSQFLGDGAERFLNLSLKV